MREYLGSSVETLVGEGQRALGDWIDILNLLPVHVGYVAVFERDIRDALEEMPEIPKTWKARLEDPHTDLFVMVGIGVLVMMNDGLARVVAERIAKAWDESFKNPRNVPEDVMKTGIQNLKAVPYETDPWRGMEDESEKEAAMREYVAKIYLGSIRDRTLIDSLVRIRYVREARTLRAFFGLDRFEKI